MAKSKLTVETVERAGRGEEICFRKDKGKITFDEVVEWFCDGKNYDYFGGKLGVFQFRVHDAEYLYDGYSGDDEGDTVILTMVEDNNECPVCGKNRLFPQYCPDCGSARVIPIEGRK